MSNDLVVFLRERLDEDEHNARGMAGFYEDAGVTREVDADGGLDGPGRGKRMLRDVEAKRQIIDELWGDDGYATDHTPPQTADAVLTLMAAAYADHPDYRADWRV